VSGTDDEFRNIIEACLTIMADQVEISARLQALTHVVLDDAPVPMSRHQFEQLVATERERLAEVKQLAFDALAHMHQRSRAPEPRNH
jgi:hypothetical protein